MTTQEILEAARAARSALGLSSGEVRRAALLGMAEALCSPARQQAILEGNAGALSLYADGRWQGSALCPEKVSADADMEKLLERCWQKQEPKKKLLAQGGRVELLYWDPAENKSFVIPAKKER